MVLHPQSSQYTDCQNEIINLYRIIKESRIKRKNKNQFELSKETEWKHMSNHVIIEN